MQTGFLSPSHGTVWPMGDSNNRLRRARENAGFDSATAAARRFGWTVSTYSSHENGQTPVPVKAAERYAKAFKVSPAWILTGEATPAKRTVPLVGYVAAGAVAHYFGDQGQLDEVEAPDGSTEDTVAVEIRGDSLGSIFDRWLVFYDEVRSPITSDLLGKLCVVGLADGRIMVKKVQKSKTPGFYHLLSNTEEPILDAVVEWAARVKNMVPQ